MEDTLSEDTLSTNLSIRKSRLPCDSAQGLEPVEKRRAPIKRKIALLLENISGYGEALLRGVAAYIREHEPWSICTYEHSHQGPKPVCFPAWRVDGFIVNVNNVAIHRQVNRLKIPVVCIGDLKYVPSWPRVKTDHLAVARMAAEHLLERGFRQFGYCGHPPYLWSIPRQEHFERLIRARGNQCSVFNSELCAGAEDAETETIGRWLAGLPKPAGIMVSDDRHGQMVLDACRRRGIFVPDEIAVISASNTNSLICESCTPPLSSVICDDYRDGYEAASMLDALMSGKKLGQKVRLVEPVEIKTRQSTDVMAIADRNIASALRYIRENACKGIKVRDVLKAVPQSRSILEYRLQKLIGRTPHEEIIRVRLNHVKMLLSDSDLTMEQIMEQTGFKHVEYLRTVFHDQIGITPGNYRQLHRSRS